MYPIRDVGGVAQTAGSDGDARSAAEEDDALAPSSPNQSISTLLDTLHVGLVLLDVQGRVLLWSPTAEEVLGWPPGRLAGRHIDTLLHGTATESASTQALRIYDVLRRDRNWQGILHARHLDGRTVEIETRVSLLSDGEGTRYIIASLAEVSALRAVDHDLAALHGLFGSAPLGIALLDSEQRYVRVNEALARLNGVPARDHPGRTVRDILPPAMAAEIHELQAGVLRTGRSVIDEVTSAPDGLGARSVSYSRLTDDSGNVLGLSCVIMDVTERRDALQKVELARQRLALLDRVGVALGDILDIRRIAQAFATALVPGFADYTGVMLVSSLVQGDELPDAEGLLNIPLMLLGVDARDRGPLVERMLQIGQDFTLDPHSPFGRTLATGVAHLIDSQEDLTAATRPGEPHVQAAVEVGVHSLMILPLRARGIVLGLLVVSRAGEREPFDQDDLTLAMELADRAGTSVDNARLYAREREGALMLQRSLLPQHVPSPPGVGVAYRYVPGSSGTEVGGDWFDVIPLAGGRVAFVVGDVMGHGLRAAATMGRLRTAVRTLAGQDLPPDRLLRRVNDLADDLAQGPDDPLMATCLYAVYDPSTRRCALAKAGHLPPLLLVPDGAGAWTAAALDLPSGAPLGVGGVDFESMELEVTEGSVLVLYTDGLVENRGEDITEGVDRLRTLLTGALATQSLEDACDAAVAAPGSPGSASPAGFTGHGDGAAAHPAHPADDAALLLARLGGLPEGSTVYWTFAAEPYAVRQARAVVRETLVEWGLAELVDETVLLVSELVTNSLRYAHGPIGVRMVRGSSLLVEVSDPLPDPPRPRNATHEDEGGRGIQLVARESRRWGTRHGALGKTVWFELALPG